jgi:hypothetical protein
MHMWLLIEWLDPQAWKWCWNPSIGNVSPSQNVHAKRIFLLTQGKKEDGIFERVISKQIINNQLWSNFLSFYFQFYEVIILGGTYANSKKEMQSVFLDIKLRL